MGGATLFLLCAPVKRRGCLCALAPGDAVRRVCSPAVVLLALQCRDALAQCVIFSPLFPSTATGLGHWHPDPPDRHSLSSFDLLPYIQVLDIGTGTVLVHDGRGYLTVINSPLLKIYFPNILLDLLLTSFPPSRCWTLVLAPSSWP